MDAKQIIMEYNNIKASRTPMESAWDELHRYYLAAGDEVQNASEPDARVYRKGQYSDLPFQALQTLTAGLHSYLTSPTGDWFSLRVTDSKLQSNDEIKRYLETVEAKLRDAIALTNFDTEQDEFYSNSACYGSALMLIEEDAEDGIRFTNIPIKNVFWVEDGKGRISKFHILFKFTAYQAITRFGEENLSKEIKDIYKKDSACQDKFDFLLSVSPRNVRDVYKEDILNMPLQQSWVEVNAAKIVQEGGYLDSPFAYHRFYKRRSTAYGYSPCMYALKSVKQLNNTLRLSVRAMAMAIDPPKDIPHNGYIGGLNFNPGGYNYRRGADRVETIQNGGNFQAADWLVNHYEESIKKSLFNDAITTLSGISKRMQNLEVQELIAEKMVLFGPAVGRYLDEFASNVIKRVLAILVRNGQIPTPPKALGEDFEYKIDFISPLAKAQRNSDLQAINTAITIIGQVSQAKPAILDNIDEDGLAKEVIDITGAPLSILAPESEVRAAREQRQAAAEKQAQMEETAMQLQGAKEAKEIEGNGA